jgi:hypothetical protein
MAASQEGLSFKLGSYVGVMKVTATSVQAGIRTLYLRKAMQGLCALQSEGCFLSRF